jgi:CBS domain-containing protein
MSHPLMTPEVPLPAEQDRPLRVEEIMTRSVVVVNPHDTIEEAAIKMKQVDIGPLPVCDHDHVVGMITDRDIVLRSVARGGNPACERVRFVMTSEVVCCYADQEAADAARLMREKNVHQLPVVDRDHHLVGIVTRGDVERGEKALHPPVR